MYDTFFESTIPHRQLTLDQEELVIALLDYMFLHGSTTLYYNRNETIITFEKIDDEYIIPPWIYDHLDSYVYVIWDNISFGIKTDIRTAFTFLDEMTKSSRTWFFNPDEGFVIQWEWCGEKCIEISTRNFQKPIKAWLIALDCLQGPVKFYRSHGHILYSIKHTFGYGKQIIDWRIVPEHKYSNSNLIFSDLISHDVQVLKESLYIIWEEDTFPAVETALVPVLLQWNLLMQTKPKYILSTKNTFVIEILDENNFIIGLRPDRRLTCLKTDSCTL